MDVHLLTEVAPSMPWSTLRSALPIWRQQILVIPTFLCIFCNLAEPPPAKRAGGRGNGARCCMEAASS